MQRPTARKISSAAPACASVTLAPRAITVIPSPIRQGVFGMARMTALSGSHPASWLRRTPAAMLMTTLPASSFRISSLSTTAETSWGFTASTTMSASRQASTMLVVARTPWVERMLAMTSARRSVATIWSGFSFPEASSPRRMASPFVPEPMTANVRLESSMMRDTIPCRAGAVSSGAPPPAPAIAAGRSAFLSLPARWTHDTAYDVPGFAGLRLPVACPRRARGGDHASQRGTESSRLPGAGGRDARVDPGADRQTRRRGQDHLARRAEDARHLRARFAQRLAGRDHDPGERGVAGLSAGVRRRSARRLLAGEQRDGRLSGRQSRAARRLARRRRGDAPHVGQSSGHHRGLVAAGAIEEGRAPVRVSCRRPLPERDAGDRRWAPAAAGREGRGCHREDQRVAGVAGRRGHPGGLLRAQGWGRVHSRAQAPARPRRAPDEQGDRARAVVRPRPRVERAVSLSVAGERQPYPADLSFAFAICAVLPRPDFATSPRLTSAARRRCSASWKPI